MMATPASSCSGLVARQAPIAVIVASKAQRSVRGGARSSDSICRAAPTRRFHPVAASQAVYAAVGDAAIAANTIAPIVSDFQTEDTLSAKTTDLAFTGRIPVGFLMSWSPVRRLAGPRHGSRLSHLGTLFASKIPERSRRRRFIAGAPDRYRSLDRVSGKGL
ncbi:MAG: hypothetical protein R3E87_05330 [Burkholderiaceae bacterium]